MPFLRLSQLLLLPLYFAAPAAAQLGPPPQPPENPSTPDKVVLGKLLFWEEQLSSDNTVACGTCHIPAFSFTDNRELVNPGQDHLFGTLDDANTSPGVVRMDANLRYQPTPDLGLRPQQTRRRTNDIFGSLYQADIFWDGRAFDQFIDPETGLVSIVTGGALESQALVPILSPIEMGHQDRDWAQVRAKLQSAVPMRLASNLPPDMASAIALHPTYPDLFAAAFGTPDITAERIAYAIAAYERELVPDQTPWDDYMNGNTAAMTPEQIDGWNQFNGIARCHLCHTPPIFSDGSFHNNGLRPVAWDGGREEVTHDPNDRGKFKTPSLRNAGLRTSFYHNGFFQQLWPQGVSNIYWGGGGGFADNRDPLLVPLSTIPGINLQNIFDFVGNALTDPRVANETYPFDRPTLYSNLHPFSSNLYGTANPGGSGVLPKITAHMPAIIGEEFQIGVSDGLGGAIAHFGASVGQAPGFFRQGALMNISLPLSQHLTFPLPGVGATDGWKAIRFTLPSNPNFVGRNFYMQWWVEDPGAPGGVASATQGAIIEILP